MVCILRGFLCTNFFFQGQHSTKTSHAEYLWSLFQTSMTPDLQTNFNQPKQKKFLKSTPDGYSEQEKTIFYFHVSFNVSRYDVSLSLSLVQQGCAIHGHFLTNHQQPCIRMAPLTKPQSLNVFGVSYSKLADDFKKMIGKILQTYDDHMVQIIYECEFLKRKNDPSSKEAAFFSQLKIDF